MTEQEKQLLDFFRMLNEQQKKAIVEYTKFKVADTSSKAV